MKRLIDIIYSDTPPEPQNALWLKRIDQFKCAPYINDNGNWVPLDITIEGKEEDEGLEYPVYYLNSSEGFNYLETLMEKDPSYSYNEHINGVSSDLPFVYLAICSDYRFTAVNADFPSDVLTGDFTLVNTDTIRIGTKLVSYKLYKFFLIDGQGHPLALGSPINFTIIDG